MKHIIRYVLSGSLLMGGLSAAHAQFPVKIHSHNDYTRTMPFYEAYSQKVYSIEVDMFYENNNFYVCHDEEDINPDFTFERMYLKPLLELYRINKGMAWTDSERPIQLMAEIKSKNTEEYLNAFSKILEKYPEVFNPQINPNAVKIVITGNIPKPEDFKKYPEYILFDGDLSINYTEEQLKRVGLFSDNFRKYSKWNGKGSIVKNEKAEIIKAIEKAHSKGKHIRFWGAPDGMTAWNTFYMLGVDYINTDKIAPCTQFFSNWHNKTYVIGDNNGNAHKNSSCSNQHAVTGTDRLDKTTHDFEGFHNNKLKLTENIPVYKPEYINDGKQQPVKNVIMLIGDGMGLSQITSADRVNNGLSMLYINYMGLISTSSLDAFTTDSAGAGSALSTGKSNSNRHICSSDEGKPYPQITDFFKGQNKGCGVVTLGNIADATPSAFYGHNVERDNSEELTLELLDGKLDLLVGSGINNFIKRKDGIDLKIKLEEKGYKFTDDTENIAPSYSEKIICIDEKMSKATEADNIGLLAEATRNSLVTLEKNSPNGFFLMVEGAKIDYAGHSNCFPGSIVETLGFDMAVAEALKFADNNGETLVIVTGDHETGGLTLIDGDNKTGFISAVYVTDDHTPIMLPVFAYGPQSDKYIGKYKNIEIPQKIKELKFK